MSELRTPMPMNKKNARIRVMLVDDHQIALDGLRHLLSSQPHIEVTGEANDARSAVDIARTQKPDVLLLNIAMPGLEGLAAVRQIRKHSPGTAVIACAMHNATYAIAEVFAAGATACVAKSDPAQTVVRAIREVANGRVFISPGIAAPPPAHGSPETEPRPDAILSDREREVLKLVAEGLSSKQVAARLFVTTKTIEWHRKSIMDKLHVRSIAELTKYAIRQGLTPLHSRAETRQGH
jgi:two-component system response regulator NreC